MVRRMALGCAALALLLLLPPVAFADGAGERPKSAAEKLIDAYVPRLMLREGDEICDTRLPRRKSATEAAPEPAR